MYSLIFCASAKAGSVETVNSFVHFGTGGKKNKICRHLVVDIAHDTLVTTIDCLTRLDKLGICFYLNIVFSEQPQSDQQSSQPASVHASGVHHLSQYDPPESGLLQHQCCLQ